MVKVSECAASAYMPLAPVVTSVFIGLLLFSLQFLFEIPAAEAGSISTNVLVTAAIRARAEVNVISEPSAISIGDDDVTRGFVEVKNGSLVELIANSNSCLLNVSIRSDFFKEVHLNIMGHEVVLGQKGGIIVLPFNKRLFTPINYRFVLAEGVRPGTYKWPVRLSAGPL